MSYNPPSCYDLDAIKTIVKITGKLRNETPLRIGLGKASSFVEPTDNPIVKRDGRPIIPGSSLKGAFRSFVESYFNTLGDRKYYVCGIDDKDCESCKEDNNVKAYCIPCILFGFKDLSARVYILDAVAEQYVISQRTMVAISRVFGGQMPGHLYTFDYVEPGATFSFTMFIYNLDIVNGESEEWKKKAVETLRYLLKTLVYDGVFVGARKSTGFGLIKLVSGSVEVRKAPDLLQGQRVDLLEVMKSW